VARLSSGRRVEPSGHSPQCRALQHAPVSVRSKTDVGAGLHLGQCDREGPPVYSHRPACIQHPQIPPYSVVTGCFQEYADVGDPAAGAWEFLTTKAAPSSCAAHKTLGRQHGVACTDAEGGRAAAVGLVGREAVKTRRCASYTHTHEGRQQHLAVIAL
jgi:hypothetical protein